MTDAVRRRAAEAMRRTPRADFLPPEEAARAGHDGPLPIGGGQTSSQPRTVLDMLELLDVRPGQRVLDVGAGSGWTTAILADLVGPQGRVTGVERVSALADRAASSVASAGRPWATVHRAQPDVLGLPGEAPYDRVLVSAMADRMPTSLVEQLVVAGVLVAPVAGRMLRVTRTTGAPVVEEHGWYSFVPLVVDGDDW
ncbi:protein-L-isoaspartate O-methyltransferase family protein [Luteipulveratus halotolerans]|uniref:Protein-L-isoaspartate O-methyltransferase n=1 Tax=Luteipulveratus halotolerans TaxID=1631356 RepID=A0A0L6CGR5_9MICO|nr:methyltransferase domain-containing protein [Luteipulveratus halotolerans]KNX36795.1 protein-L-isoaspartate carboxylmethyltransferase [Luteipulveratus halotolerans]